MLKNSELCLCLTFKIRHYYYYLIQTIVVMFVYTLSGFFFLCLWCTADALQLTKYEFLLILFVMHCVFCLCGFISLLGSRKFYHCLFKLCPSSSFFILSWELIWCMLDLLILSCRSLDFSFISSILYFLCCYWLYSSVSKMLL